MKPFLVLLPTLGVNDNEARIFWEMAPGSSVVPGSVIARAETTKTTVEIEAGESGFLYPIVKAGDTVSFGDPIAAIDPRPDLRPEDVAGLVPSRTTPDARETGPRWTLKARLLAEASGVPLGAVAPGTTGTIREEDVRRYLEGTTRGGPEDAVRVVEGTARRRDLVDDAHSTGKAIKLLVVGGGDGCVQVLDVVTKLSTIRPVAILDDDPKLADADVMGVPIVGPIGAAEALFKQKVFDAAVISISTSRQVRRTVFERLSGAGIPFANVVDPTSAINSNVEIGSGNVVLAHCHIGAGASIGDNNFLSAYVSIEHHSSVGNHCTFGPAVVTSGHVRIGDDVKFGTGIFLEPHVEVGSHSVVASGVALTASIPERSLVRAKERHSIEKLPAGPEPGG